MKKWYTEDWQFTIEVLQLGKENKAKECRLGFEVGDKFICQLEIPYANYMAVTPMFIPFLKGNKARRATS